jgi:hypothetical protein
MKYLLVSIAIVIALSAWVRPAQASFLVNAPRALGLHNGLVGWWTFDGKDISGVQAYDRSGNGNRGILTSGPVQAAGKLGQALQFDGRDDYVDVSGSTQYVQASAPFTVSAAVRKEEEDPVDQSEEGMAVHRSMAVAVVAQATTAAAVEKQVTAKVAAAAVADRAIRTAAARQPATEQLLAAIRTRIGQRTVPRPEPAEREALTAAIPARTAMTAAWLLRGTKEPRLLTTLN